MYKGFNIGDVVYWIDRKRGQWQPKIRFGTILEVYPGSVVLQLYEVPTTVTVEGIRAKDFKTPTKWRKLPNGWTYNTELLEFGIDLTVIPMSCRAKVFDIKNKSCLEEFIREGGLIPVQENDHSSFRTEITKEGWRIVRDYFGVKEPLTTISLCWNEFYSSYEEADAVMQADLAELNRIANLSDYDWSVEQIDKALEKLRVIMQYPEDRIRACREFLLSQDKVEDIDVRVSMKGLEWKYDRNRRWNTVVI